MCTIFKGHNLLEAYLEPLPPNEWLSALDLSSGQEVFTSAYKELASWRHPREGVRFTFFADEGGSGLF